MGLWRQLEERILAGVGGYQRVLGGTVVRRFNIIRFPNERNKSGSISSSMRNFSEFIEDLELLEPPV